MNMLKLHTMSSIGGIFRCIYISVLDIRSLCNISVSMEVVKEHAKGAFSSAKKNQAYLISIAEAFEVIEFLVNVHKDFPIIYSRKLIALGGNSGNLQPDDAWKSRNLILEILIFELMKVSIKVNGNYYNLQTCENLFKRFKKFHYFNI